VGSAARELAGGDPEGPGKGRAQSSTFKYVPDTDGKARLGKRPVPPAVQQADGETLPRVSSKAGLEALRHTEIHRYTGGSSGIRVGWLEYRALKTPGEGRRTERTVAERRGP